MHSITNEISEIIQKYDKEELLLNKLLDEKWVFNFKIKILLILYLFWI